MSRRRKGITRRKNVSVEIIGGAPIQNVHFLDIDEDLREKLLETIHGNPNVMRSIYLKETGQDVGYIVDGPENKKVLQVRVDIIHLPKIKECTKVIADTTGVKPKYYIC